MATLIADAGGYRAQINMVAMGIRRFCLEMNLPGQLNGSAIGEDGAGDLSEVGRSHRLAWGAEVGVVEEVEELAA